MNSQTEISGRPSDEKVILIAEDDDTSYALFKAYFSKQPFRLIRARNGHESLQLFRENPDINLILMDLKMPVMDGYEATRKLREMDKEIPIIAQTAYALSGDSQKAIAAGCDDYIAKPIRKEDLLVKMEALFNR